MRSGNPQLVALMIAAPQQAHAKIRAAMRGRSVTEAAIKLGVNRRTLTRWLEQHPELRNAKGDA